MSKGIKIFVMGRVVLAHVGVKMIGLVHLVYPKSTPYFVSFYRMALHD